MSLTSHLQIPKLDTFRRRADSFSEEQDRYVVTGGFVSIQDLAKSYEASRDKKSKQHFGLFGSVSPRSRSSRASSITDAESQTWDSVSTSPYRSEGRSSPQTPQTPFSGTKQTVCSLDQTINISPPPLSRYNQCGHEIYLNSSPSLGHLPENPFAFESSSIVTPTQSQSQSRSSIPVELAGSLLLPSQGFPQSNPPKVPPRVHERSRSAPVISRLLSPLSMIPEHIHSRGDSHIPEPDKSLFPTMSALSESEMTKFVRKPRGSHSISTPEWDRQDTLPTRKSSLRSRPSAPQHKPPPVPLSQMTLEELMQILPNLDAAIVAHDWKPCVQKRHHELKGLLQRLQDAAAGDASLQNLNEVCSRNIFSRFMKFANLRQEPEKVLNQVQDVAKTYHELFEIAKDLQITDFSNNVEIDKAYAQRSEAMIALARYVSKHTDVCGAYERDMQEYKDMTRHIHEAASKVIQQYLDGSGSYTLDQSALHVLELMKSYDSPMDMPARYITTDLFHDTQKAVKKATEEKHDLQQICSSQMATIKNQSSQLDQYLARMAKIVGMMQDKEHANQVLREQNEELRVMAEAHKNAVRVDQQSKLDCEHSRRAVSQVGSLDIRQDDELWARDAEIANLRGKLEKAFIRERELQTQIRSLLQSSQNDGTAHKHGRLKRLLISGSRGTPNLPTTTSMHNLSHSIFTPFETGKPPSVVPPSPTRSAKTSPSLVGLCEPALIDNLDLPPLQYGHNRTRSSVELGPRLREGFQSPQDREINSAVSGRFYHMPSNVRSAASISGSQTQNEDRSKISNDEITDFDRPRQHSAPGALDLGDESLQQAQSDRDRQALVNHQRVLSGITEVTEDTGSVKRKSSSPDSTDRKMYLDSMHALGRLQIHY